MKAIFVELDREIKLVGDVNMRCSPDANTVYNATFPLAEKPFDEEAGETLTGDIIWSSDDDFAMRVFSVEDFLRFKLTENKPSIPVQYDPETGEEIVPSEEDMAELEAEQLKNTTWTLLLDTEPEPPPPPEPPEPEPIPEPTEEELIAELRNRLPNELREMREKCIAMGVYVQTEYGIERFSLEERDRTMVMAIYSMVQSGITSFPYHSIGANDMNRMCTVYSDSDIVKIAMSSFAFITFHESYANMLGQWLMRVTSIEEARRIAYGAELPDDLQEYLQMVMMGAIMSVPEGTEVHLPLNMPTDGPSILLPGMVFDPSAILPPADGGEEAAPDNEDNMTASAEEQQSESQASEDSSIEDAVEDTFGQEEIDTGNNETNDEVMFDPEKQGLV